MSYKYNRITFRPEPDLVFWEWPEEITQYVADTYDSTGLRESCTVTVSDDGFIQTRTSVWKDRESHVKFCKDPVMIGCLRDRDAYNTSNDILSFWQREL